MLQNFRAHYSRQYHVSLLQLQHTLRYLIWISKKLLCQTSINHHLLLTKLQHYGIRGNFLNWISEFLLLRTERIVCRGSSSKPIDVTSGVPQGVLGPLLFFFKHT